MVTFIPEKKEGRPIEGGVNVELKYERITGFTDRFHSNSIIVSYFIDPEIEQVKASARAGADYIEINTEEYVNAKDADEEEAELHRIISTVQAGSKLGLGINAGSGLNYFNVSEISNITQIEEVNIGHSIISKAVIVGLDRAIKDMLHIIR